MGHPVLEASVVVPGVPGAHMASHARIHANNDAYERGIATDSHGCPFRGHPCALPSSVGLDGCAPLVLARPYNSPDTTVGAEGTRTPPHYSDTPAIILPFNLAQVGILPKMSPVTDRENELMNLVLGSPVMRTAPPGLGQGWSRSGCSSCSGSPMSLGSPAGMSLTLALKVRTHPVTAVMFGSCSREDPPKDGDEEDMDAAEDDVEEEED